MYSKDTTKKVWKTWRQWFKDGQHDKLAGREAQFLHQPDYMEGYRSVLLTSAQYDAMVRTANQARDNRNINS